MVREGRGVEKDTGRAAGLFRRACEGSMFEGCLNLGHAYAAGDGVMPDEERALRHSSAGLR